MRVLKWTAGFIAVVVLAAVLFVVFGLNTLKGPITRAVGDATGRELKIEGDLRPIWSWVHPRFRADRVSLSNPDWAKEPNLFTADSVELTLSVLPLLRGRVVLPEVHLEKPDVYLEVGPEGQKSWILDKEQKADQQSRVRIQRLTLDEGMLSYDDLNQGTAITADLTTDDAGVVFNAAGTYWGMPALAAGQGGPVLSLRDESTPYPLKAEVKIGDTYFAGDGTITDLADLGAIDMQVRLSGSTMEDLYWVIGIAMPDTKPYSTAGKIVHKDKTWRYEGFSGKVGASDLAGTLQVDTGGARPKMEGDLHSKLLDLADLGAVVGTKQSSGKGVLPDAPFSPERWRSVDADVRLKAGRIQRPEQLPLENLSTRIRMLDALLTLDPLEFGAAGGKLAGTIRLDGRQSVIKAQARIKAQKLQLAKLFPTMKLAQASIGDLNGAIEIGGTGNSVKQMLGTSSGKIGMFVDSGQVNEMVLHLAAINLWGMAQAKLRGEQPVNIRCVVGDFGVKDGVATTNAFVFDTDILVIHGDGTINLKDEVMDLTLKPEPKRGSLASLRSPLHVRGTFSDPKVSPEMGTIAARGAGAIAMALVSPLLALIPLIDEGPGKNSNCGALIDELSASAKSAASAGGSKPR